MTSINQTQIKRMALMLMSVLLSFQLILPTQLVYGAEGIEQAGMQNTTVMGAEIGDITPVLVKLPFMLVLSIMLVTMYFMAVHTKKRRRFNHTWEIQEFS